jgi:hypothetical protein
MNQVELLPLVTFLKPYKTVSNKIGLSRFPPYKKAQKAQIKIKLI